MALAVVASAGQMNCVMGSAPDTVTAAIAPAITLNGNTAETILDAKVMPNFQTCTMWAAITLGSQTDCVPIIIPVWIPGVPGVLWNMIPACDSASIYICALGTILVSNPGTDILIV